MIGHKSAFKTGLRVFAAAPLFVMLLSGCRGKVVNPNLTYGYSKSSPIFAFCESLRKSIENSPKNLLEYDRKNHMTGGIQEETLPNLEEFMSNLDVSFDFLDWVVVDPTDRKDAYIRTFPLQSESYDQNGIIRNLSIDAIQEYIDQFEENAKGTTYAKSKIDKSGYVFWRRLSQADYDKTGQIPDQFSRDLTHVEPTNPFYNSSISVEFDGLLFTTNTTAEMIVVFEGHILFLDVFPSYKWQPASLNIRIFDQNLKPGEKPFVYKHPTRPGEVSGPLRHMQDNGCRFIFRAPDVIAPDL